MDTLVLINPDNPSGYYMGQSEIVDLLQWCKEENKNLIVDESFLDFADEENASLLSESILSENPQRNSFFLFLSLAESLHNLPYIYPISA